jgi:hypothetical protein
LSHFEFRGVHIFTRGYERQGSRRIFFPGDSVESKFSKWLSDIRKEKKDIVQSQGVEISMIGTYSIRKGVASSLIGAPGDQPLFLII